MIHNEENCAKLNKLVRVMRIKKVTKEEVMSMFGTNERTARDMLHERGYRIANRGSPEDIRAARHAYNENRKRADEILKRNSPLAQVLGIEPKE